MAFTETENNPARWFDFEYFATNAANGVATGTVAPGVRFRLAEIRVHCSSTFASTEDLTVRLSSINGSQYNLMLVSQAMNGVRDYYRIFAEGADYKNAPLFLSDDQLIVTLTGVSNINVVGITAIGWAIRG